MKRIRPRAAGIALTAIIGVTGVAGCGGGGHATTAPSIAPTTSGTYTPLTAKNFSTTVSAATKAKKSVHMTMRMGTLMRARAVADYSGSSPSAEMSTTLSYAGRKVTMQVRVIGGTSYIAVTGLTPAGKFVKVDKDTPGLGALTKSLGSSDPSKLTTAFSQGVSTVKYLGPAEVGGTRTYHYALTVDTSKALGAMGLDSVVGSSGKGVPDSLTEQVYLNADNTLRRGVIEVKGQKGHFDLTGWGEPVQVKAPPASKVMTLPSGSASADPQ